MIRHTFTATLTDQDLAELDAALTTLEQKLRFTVGVDARKRRSLRGMGPDRKFFADKALQGAVLNPGLLPRDLSIAAIEADKTLREQLQTLAERLRRVDTKLDHTVFLLGSEYYAGALAIYQALKLFGMNAGIAELLADLKCRFKGGPRKPASASDAEDSTV